MTTVADVIELMEIIAPPHLATAHDVIGLHAGDPARRVTRVLVALDATSSAVKEAKRLGCQMLVVHHPRFYKPLGNLAETSAMGIVAGEIARANLAVYCAHTNLDIAPGGINDQLADAAGLGDTRPVQITGSDPHGKLAVFVPDSHVDAVREAMCAAGAGVIGEYNDCSFRLRGTGTFRGSDKSNPYLGKAGRLETADEWRLEVVLPDSLRHAVVSAMKSAHPYEEVAYDLYPLKTSTPFGCGRYGTLPKLVTLDALARKMKKACAAPGALLCGDPKRKVRRVAVWSGGGAPAETLRTLGVDVLVTGELGYHEQELLQMGGVDLVLLGHGPSEEIALPRLAENLREGLDDVTIHVFRDAVRPARSL